jgi:hypothetical protein
VRSREPSIVQSASGTRGSRRYAILEPAGQDDATNRSNEGSLAPKVALQLAIEIIFSTAKMAPIVKPV